MTREKILVSATSFMSRDNATRKTPSIQVRGTTGDTAEFTPRLTQVSGV
jgi:hypothetical protein